MTTTAQGGCLCGGVRFEAEVTDEVSICHCETCRRWTGGPMMAVHPNAPAAIEGETLTWFRSSDWAERGFCSRCGASLFYRLTEHAGDVVIAAGSFDDPTAFNRLAREIFIDEKPGFYEFEGDRPRMTGAEAIAEFTGTEEQTA